MKAFIASQGRAKLEAANIRSKVWGYMGIMESAMQGLRRKLTPTMENKMEDDMETDITEWSIGMNHPKP